MHWVMRYTMYLTAAGLLWWFLPWWLAIPCTVIALWHLYDWHKEEKFVRKSLEPFAGITDD